MGVTPWGLADAQCCQYVRHDGYKYEMIMCQWLDRTSTEIEMGVPAYVILRTEIDLNNCTINDIECALAAHDRTIGSVVDEYGREGAIDYFAAALLEKEIMNDGCIIGEANSFDEAKEFVQKEIANEL